MPGTPHVPPDSQADPFANLWREEVAESFQFRAVPDMAETARILRNLSTGLQSADLYQVQAPETAPEPTPAPEPERWPRSTVWIMSSPSRRGPSRVSPIDRSARWLTRYEAVRARGSLGLPSDMPRFSAGFTAPTRVTGSLANYHWFFLGWHSNGHPMFAVQMRQPIEDESDIRQAIRERISYAVTRLQCNFCYTAYPVSEEWPIPHRRTASIRMSGYGQTNACGTCSAGFLSCNAAGCRERGRSGDMIPVSLDALGTQRANFCASHSGSVTRCIHCHLRFPSAEILFAHDCTGSGVPWERCTVCSNQTRRWELVTFSDGTRTPVCRGDDRRCMRTVRACGICRGYTRAWVVMGASSSMAPNQYVCVNCVSAHSIDDCEHCSLNYPAADDHNCWSGGRCACDTCSGRVIRSYSYKPKARFQGSDRHGLFLGMELEIFCDRTKDVHEVARAVQQDVGRTAYIKSDGSISHGFELVTHPMSYEYAMSEFPWEVLKTMSDAGSFATEGSGIHIHASRKGFAGPAHEYRWMIFLYRNQRQAQVIARRVSSSWASFSAEQRRRAKDIATKKHRDTERYRAINQLNTDTVEVRIFQSSTDEQTVKATIGFVHASIEYARVIRARDVLHDDAWSWKAFAKWVKAQKVYAPLYAEMERLGIIGDELTEPTQSDPRARAQARTHSECDYDCNGSDSCNGSCDCDDCAGCTYGDSDW